MSESFAAAEFSSILGEACAAAKFSAHLNCFHSDSEMNSSLTCAYCSWLFAFLNPYLYLAKSAVLQTELGPRDISGVDEVSFHLRWLVLSKEYEIFRSKNALTQREFPTGFLQFSGMSLSLCANIDDPLWHQKKSWSYFFFYVIIFFGFVSIGAGWPARWWGVTTGRSHRVRCRVIHSKSSNEICNKYWSETDFKWVVKVAFFFILLVFFVTQNFGYFMKWPQIFLKEGDKGLPDSFHRLLLHHSFIHLLILPRIA